MALEECNVNKMQSQFDLVTLGEILLRLSPPLNERLDRKDIFYKQIGGSELNVASGVALLGLRTGIISKVPNNTLGSFVKKQTRLSQVSDDFLQYDNEKDARLGIYYYENGAYPRKPSVVYDRLNSSMIKLDETLISDYAYHNCKMFHTSGITLALNSQLRNNVISIIKKFKENGALISFDVNYRMNLWSEEEARAVILQVLPYVDVFFCSQETARLMFKKKGDFKKIMQEFATEYNIRVVASTQRVVHSPKKHDFGSIIYDANKNIFYEEEAYQNIEVVDRIGSGDAYVSGVLYALLKYEIDCHKALQYGNAMGALKNTVPGDLPFCSKEEVETIINDHHTLGYKSEMVR